MLDVHPAHHAATTWRDFFIHIATIVLGLMIAVGLEQSVEALHRHHERDQLRAALDAESHQILFDTTRGETSATLDLQWIKQMEDQVSAAARDHHPIDKLAQRTPYGADVPDEPVYKASKASGKLALLTEEETVAYGELDGVLTRNDIRYEHWTEALRALDTSVRDLAFALPTGAKPLSAASPTDLNQLYTLMVQFEVATRDMRYWSRQARGAATALLAGERDLHKLQAAERQFDKLP